MQEKPLTSIEFIKKHKERIALLGVLLAFLLFIGGGIYLQKNNRLEKDPLSESSLKSVKLETAQTANGTTMSTGAKGRNPRGQAVANTSYLLKPSPEELLKKLASMENFNENVVNAKFSQMPVLWPGYFFSLQKTEDGQTSLLLDVSEDGFGVMIESVVDLSKYPELRELKSGEKVWIGGKILAVDPSGTGRIYLKTEQLRFGDEAPYLQKTPKTDK